MLPHPNVLPAGELQLMIEPEIFFRIKASLTISIPEDSFVSLGLKHGQEVAKDNYGHHLAS